MKRVFTSIIATVFMVTAISTAAFAKDEKMINPGITPDSILYPIDRLVENIQLKLTVDEAKKVGLLINMSTERFDEAEVMADKDKEDKSVKAIEDGQKAIEDAEKVVAIDDEKKASELEEAKEELQEFTKKSVERLREIAARDNTPEHAQLVLERVAAMQQVNYLEKLMRKAKKSNDEQLLSQLNEKLTEAKAEYSTAKTAVEEYKNQPKNEEKDNDKETKPNNDNSKNQEKEKEKNKDNKGQSKEKKGNNN